MCEFAKCCCCVDLRLGAILIAVLDIIFGILMILKSFTRHTHVNFIASNYTRILDMEDSDKDQIWMKCMELENITALASVAAGVFLIIGATKYNKMTTAVYLGMQMIGTACLLVPMTFHTVNYVQEQEHDNKEKASFGIRIALFSIIFILSIYFWICVFSFCKHLRRGKGFMSWNRINGEEETPMREDISMI